MASSTLSTSLNHTASHFTDGTLSQAIDVDGQEEEVQPRDDFVRGDSPELEPLSGVEIELLHQKAMELNGGRDDAELAAMILRLTSTVPSPQQILEQAQTISNLSQQRDFLMRRYEEEKLRWETEKDAWSRTSEILLSRSVTEGGRSRELQLEQRNNAVLSENMVMRQKLHENAQRLAHLESEIAQLRPLLLMQPFALMHSHPSVAGAQRPFIQPPTLLPTAVMAASQPQAEGEPKTPAATTTTFRAPTGSPPKPKGDYYRKRSPILVNPAANNPTPAPATNTNNNVASTSATASTSTNMLDAYTNPPATPNNKNIVPQPPPIPPHMRLRPKTLSADARSEHLLLAARKIGRERATLLSGVYIPPPTTFGGYLPATQYLTHPHPHPQAHPHPHSPQNTTQNRGAVTTFSPIFAPGSAAYPYPFPKTPPQRSRGQHVNVGVKRGAIAPRNYYPNHNSSKAAPGATPSGSGKTGGASSSKTANATANASPGKDKTVASPNNAAAITPSALDNLLSAAQTVLSSPTTPTVRRGKRRRLGPAPVGRNGSPDIDIADLTPPQLARKWKGKGKHADDEDPEPHSREATRSPGTDGESGNRFSALDVLANQATIHHSNESQSASAEEAELESEDEVLDEVAAKDTWKEREKEREREKSPVPARSRQPDDLGDETDADADGEADIDIEGDGDIDVEMFSPNEKDKQAATSSAASNSNSNASRGTSALAPPITLHSAQTMPLIPVGPPIFAQGRIPISQSMPTMGSASASAANPKGSFIHHEPGTGKRTRSPYTKWTAEEDLMLENAVSKHGQKWDLVQKELPKRGYHQVRQRWLRKQGAFDSRVEVTGFSFASTSPRSVDSGLYPDPATPTRGASPLALASNARDTRGHN